MANKSAVESRLCRMTGRLAAANLVGLQASFFADLSLYDLGNNLNRFHNCHNTGVFALALAGLGGCPAVQGWPKLGMDADNLFFVWMFVRQFDSCLVCLQIDAWVEDPPNLLPSPLKDIFAVLVKAFKIQMAMGVCIRYHFIFFS